MFEKLWLQRKTFYEFFKSISGFGKGIEQNGRIKKDSTWRAP